MNDKDILKSFKSRGALGKTFIILIRYGGELGEKFYKFTTRTDGGQLLELTGHNIPDLVMVGH